VKPAAAQAPATSPESAPAPAPSWPPPLGSGFGGTDT
jgi:hypothetical protein